MKRILLITLLILAPLAFTASAQSGRISRSAVGAFITECKHYDGVETFRMGRIATGAAKILVRTATIGDPDAWDALMLMKGIKSIYLMDYSDCDDRVKEKITTKLDKLLSKGELLMEARDNGDQMQIFGSVSKNGDYVKDFVLYTPSDATVICVFGRVSLEDFSRLTVRHD